MWICILSKCKFEYESECKSDCEFEFESVCKSECKFGCEYEHECHECQNIQVAKMAKICECKRIIKCSIYYYVSPLLLCFPLWEPPPPVGG